MTTFRSTRPFRGSRTPPLDYALTLDDDRRADRRSLLAGLSVATAAHLLLLVTRLPVAPPLPPPPAPPDIFEMRELSLAPPKPPEPSPTLPQPSSESAPRVPVPSPLVPTIEPLPPSPLPLEPLIPTLAPAPVLALPEPPAASEPLRVGGDVQPPVRLSGEPPVYTEAARLARRRGLVVVDAVIGADGAVADIRVVKGLGFGLDQEVVRALGGWRFQPGTLHGEPVAVRYHLTVRFEGR